MSSARDRYRRPSFFALLLGMLVSLVAGIASIRLPRPHKPDLSRIRALGMSGAAKVKRGAAGVGRAWNAAAIRLPRPAWLVRSAGRVSGGLRAARRGMGKGALRVRSAVTGAAGRARGRMKALGRSIAGRPLWFALWALTVTAGFGLGVAAVRYAPTVLASAKAKWTETFAAPVIYTVSAPDAPALLDPARASTEIDTGHLQLIFEGLTRLDYRLNVVPAAAASWTFSEDGLEIVFTLRPDLQYSDGSPLNARRFEYALLRALDPRASGPGASLLDGVVGARAFRTAAPDAQVEILAELRSAVGIKARDAGGALCSSYEQPDCLNLHVNLTAPDYGFPARMAHRIAYPLKEEAIGEGQWYRDPRRLVGNGPFKLISLGAARGELAANEHYWGQPPEYGLEILYGPLNADSVPLEQYKSGAIDVLPVSGDSGPALAASGLNRDLRRQTGTCTAAITIDATIAPFDDPAVRAAFAHAVSREAFVRELLASQASPTLAWVPPGLPGYTDGGARWGYDPALARETLSESTYAGSLPPITVQHPNTPADAARWSWLKARWQDVLGVSIALEAVPDGTTPGGPLAFVTLCGEIADPAPYLEYWRSTGPAAAFHYANPEVDALLDTAARASDPAERLDLYRQAHNLVIGDLPAILLYNDQRSLLFRSGLLPHGTPFDALFPVDVDPTALTAVQDVKYMPIIGR